MKTSVHHRAAALLMALLLTSGILGSIDHLAAAEAVAPAWACAVGTPHA